MKTVLVIKKEITSGTVPAGNGMSGYRLDLEVVNASEITPKIFVMQREVLSSGSPDEYEDQFYTVASVPQLESVPESPSTEVPFYRTSSISLIFSTVEGRDTYTQKILALIEKLRAANDVIINLDSPVEVAFPPEAISRFWGFSVDTSIPPSEILAASSDAESSKVFSKVLENLSSAYFFFAIRSTLGDIEAIHIQGILQTFVASTVSIEVLDGFSTEYRLFRTSNQIAPSSSLLVETE